MRKTFNFFLGAPIIIKVPYRFRSAIARTLSSLTGRCLVTAARGKRLYMNWDIAMTLLLLFLDTLQLYIFIYLFLFLTRWQIIIMVFSRISTIYNGFITCKWHFIIFYSSCAQLMPVFFIHRQFCYDRVKIKKLLLLRWKNIFCYNG